MKTRTSFHAECDLEDGYKEFESSVATAMAKFTTKRLFTTDANSVLGLSFYKHEFIAKIPIARRRHYDCHQCRWFVNKFGTLVHIREAGNIQTLWDLVSPPKFFQKSVDAMNARLRKASVTGAFVSSQLVLGTPVTGEWTHLAGRNTNPRTSLAKTPEQITAQYLEDFWMLSRGLDEFPAKVVDEAVRVLRADALSRGEKSLAAAEWLVKLHADIANYKPNRDNLIWRAVASAPPGWCHVKTNMISTLLDDVVQGYDFDTISRRWAEKVHPLQYQRPQAAPKAGNIIAAVKLVDKLGIERSLERRYATLDEVQGIWFSADKVKKQTAGVFSHITPKQESIPTKLQLPCKTMTLEKAFPLLLSAKRIELTVSFGRSNFCALVTAAHMDSPPILQWDNEACRNPVSWYVYHGGSLASEFGITSGSVKVNAICKSPAHWNSPEKYTHFEEGLLFILNDAADKRKPGGALFPEILKSELHDVRSVVEAYSRTATISGEGTACGILFSKSSKEGVSLCVDGQDVLIDRWE